MAKSRGHKGRYASMGMRGISYHAPKSHPSKYQDKFRGHHMDDGR